MLSARLSVWSEVQMICIRSSRCHCHPSSLASLKSRMVLPFWCRITQDVLEKRLLNGCLFVSRLTENWKWKWKIRYGAVHENQAVMRLANFSVAQWRYVSYRGLLLYCTVCSTRINRHHFTKNVSLAMAHSVFYIPYINEQMKNNFNQKWACWYWSKTYKNYSRLSLITLLFNLWFQSKGQAKHFTWSPDSVICRYTTMIKHSVF